MMTGDHVMHSIMYVSSPPNLDLRFEHMGLQTLGIAQRSVENHFEVNQLSLSMSLRLPLMVCFENIILVCKFFLKLTSEFTD